MLKLEPGISDAGLGSDFHQSLIWKLGSPVTIAVRIFACTLQSFEKSMANRLRNFDTNSKTKDASIHIAFASCNVLFNVRALQRKL
jgi:hypothetical protein